MIWSVSWSSSESGHANRSSAPECARSGGATYLPLGSIELSRCGAHLGRRFSEPSTEDSVEIRQVAKADLVGNGADRLTGKTRADQHLMGACQALDKHEVCECSSIRLEQELDGPRRQPARCRDRSDRQIGSTDVLDDVGFDRAQPGGTPATIIS